MSTALISDIKIILMKSKKQTGGRKPPMKQKRKKIYVTRFEALSGVNLREIMSRTPRLPKDRQGPFFSPGIDPLTIEKKAYLVGKGFYRCAHAGCYEILSRQYWRPHIELDHIDGKRRIKKEKGEVFPCTECGLVFATRQLKEQHRTSVHDLR